MTATITTSSRNVALTTSRIVAGLLGSSGLAGVAYFVFIAPDEAVWVGPWLDIPIVALMLSGFFLKLGVALLPGLQAARRITMGFVAVAIAVAVTLVKVPVYNEPEGILILGFDAVLLALLTLAWRADSRQHSIR